MGENEHNTGDKSHGSQQNSGGSSAIVSTPPAPSPPPVSQSSQASSVNSTSEEVDVESLFKTEHNEVRGDGLPTPSHRVHAFRNGYRLTKTETGWVAKKR